MGNQGHTGRVILRHTPKSGAGRWIEFVDPVETLFANRLSEVMPALQRVEEAVDRGLYAAGFVTYEAAPAFDPALPTRETGPLPFLWFGLYRTCRELRPELDDLPESSISQHWQADTTEDKYVTAIARIKELIAAGDTYQVNYSLRLRGAFPGDPWAMFRDLIRAQPVPYAAFIDTGRQAICSASPELFFRLDGNRITCRPMKGTAKRGLWWSDDECRAAALRQSPKNRAENIMIVDMMRNDLGRIARTGTVDVPNLFEIERYRTVFQMTSTVEAATDASVADIFRALFPCSSVTGAPKVRTMQIIAELEKAPRGIYTGAIGFLAPGRQAQFSVAIRTAHVDRSAGTAEYGIGSGIVWDSTDREEYDECLAKGAVLSGVGADFSLLETMLWTAEDGYFLLRRHLQRLSESARYFGFRLDTEEISRRLTDKAAAFTGHRCRARLLVDKNGEIGIESAAIKRGPRTWHAALAAQPVDRNDCFLYHKTTNRNTYDNARASCPGFDDVILWNNREEVTESSIANVVIRREGRLITPPIACGLLSGAYRQHLLEEGKIAEEIIHVEDLARAERVFLINSVRGWIPCRLSTALP